MTTNDTPAHTVYLLRWPEWDHITPTPVVYEEMDGTPGEIRAIFSTLRAAQEASGYPVELWELSGAEEPDDIFEMMPDGLSESTTHMLAELDDLPGCFVAIDEWDVRDLKWPGVTPAAVQ